jgi:hypothetical protein
LPQVTSGLVHPVVLVHWPLLQAWPVRHATHAPPPMPHAVVAVPTSHWPPEQHPVEHDVESHTHAPPTHARPLLQLPVEHWPPQPSLAPHTAPTQLGTHTQVPVGPQLVPCGHVTHATPPVPHAPGAVPLEQATPLQHPSHVAGSHSQAPPTQTWPVPQMPFAHTPEHPSFAPHTWPAHRGMHSPPSSPDAESGKVEASSSVDVSGNIDAESPGESAAVGESEAAGPSPADASPGARAGSVPDKEPHPAAVARPRTQQTHTPGTKARCIEGAQV